jgi:hypothetical protein
MASILGIGHRRLELGHLGRQRAHRSHAVHHRGDRTHARHLADILAEIADGHARIDRDLAVVRLLRARDHAEDRGLAGAVGAYQPHFLALLQAHRGVDEQDLVAVLLADVVETNHGAGAEGKDAPRQGQPDHNVAADCRTWRDDLAYDYVATVQSPRSSATRSS